jgi:hypothetical protein
MARDPEPPVPCAMQVTRGTFGRTIKSQLFPAGWRDRESGAKVPDPTAKGDEW